MRARHMAVGLAAVAAIGVSGAYLRALGPAAAPPAGAYTAPRGQDGKPDLQGVWTNNAATPVERPKVIAEKATLTDAELRAVQKRAAALFNGDGDAGFGDSVFTAALSDKSSFVSTDGETGDYNHFWVADRWFDHRTSLVIDPPDGRIPAYTPDAQKRADAQAERRKTHPADSAADRNRFERCIGTGDHPNLLAGYNSNFQIIQGGDYVVILSELIHDARIVPMDGRPHLGKHVKLQLGDSRGRWEGDTLVVDTTNFSSNSNLRGASENLHLVERFTRTAADTIEYEFTASDPTTWTRPWTAKLLWKASKDRLFEYACHEGNLGLTGILGGHRAEEKVAGGSR
jgi:hypothetical protein